MTKVIEQESRPPQFTLRQLFVLILVAAIVLALVTQLRHVGLVAAAFVVGGAGGLWRRDWRLVAASATALAIFVITYLACWLPLGTGRSMEHRSRSAARFMLEQLEGMVQRYERTYGEIPETLAEATQEAGEPQFPLVDSWGSDYQYRRTSDGFELSSFGRDRKPGGAGLDADLVVTPRGWRAGPSHRLPLRQFLFEADGSGPLFMVATLASFAAAALWYRAQPPKRPAARWLVLSLIGTVGSAVVVAIFLAAFYIAASQSGH